MFGCRCPKDKSFNPPNERPVSAISVEDATEVDILQEQTGIEIVKVELPLVYFHSDKTDVLAALKSAGYEEPKRQEPLQVYTAYGMVSGEQNMERIASFGLKLLNREKDHVVVFGNLDQLQAAAKGKLNIKKLDYEPRPREIVVQVNSPADVEKLAAIQVDIFASYPDEGKQGIIVEGAAFDFQIDQVKSLGFQITVK